VERGRGTNVYGSMCVTDPSVVKGKELDSCLGHHPRADMT